MRARNHFIYFSGSWEISKVTTVAEYINKMQLFIKFPEINIDKQRDVQRDVQKMQKRKCTKGFEEQNNFSKQ